MASFLLLGKPGIYDGGAPLPAATVPFPHNSTSHVSRCSAIGDKKLKQWVIGRPDTAEFDIDDQCEYLILGCDGLFDMMDLDKVRC
jgi:serine/threonine protein phosphatase PrpC